MGQADTERFQTSKWYGGGGRIDTDDKAQRFKLHATLTVEAEVRVVSGVFDPDNETLAGVYRDYGRVVVVVDQTVDELYGAGMRGYFKAHDIACTTLPIRAWEEDKTQKSVDRLLAFFRASSVSRHEPVLVIGGGALADVAGLAAALHHRRTPYVMIGTTVVSAIDAGPSPRTCVNGECFKNHMGAFHLPVLTLVDRDFFKTLATGHVRHGMAEILKMSFVDDHKLFELMRDHGPALLETKFAAGQTSGELAEVADEIIYRALRSYMSHEGTNPWEVHQARPHAFGHTWSPGYELQSGLLHGHAVSSGMSLGASLAHKLGWIDASQRDDIIGVCASLGLTVSHPVLEDQELLRSSQRKMIEKRGGTLWAPLPRDEIGACDYLESIEDGLLASVANEHVALCASMERGGQGLEMYLADVGRR